MPKQHAICSASSSARWIACPGSALINAQAEEQGSPYAQQGTDAHSLCEYLVLKALGRKVRDPTEDLSYYDAEMLESAEGYRNFVMEKLAKIKKTCPDPFVAVEQRLDFSSWVPEGFGTGDCLIVGDGILQIIDFKYGVGVLVSAEKNTQLMCYALGALDAFGDLYDVKTVRLAIYQPRRDNISEYELSVDDLMTWADEVLVPAAKKAYAGEQEFHAGDHCQFCHIKATCRTLAEYETELLKYGLEDPAELDDDEIAAILQKIDSLVSWADDVKAYALEQALSGKHYTGFKVVEGKSNRKYTNEDAVAEAVEKAGFDPYEKRVLGITAMQKTLGKKKFDEILSGLIYKPQGKPVLVAESDKRPEYTTVTNSDFDNMEDK